MRHARLIAVAAMISLLGSGAVSATVVTSHLESDLEFQSLLPEENVAFLVDGRVGDGAGTGSYELGVGQNAETFEATAHRTWENSISETFSVSYDKFANTTEFVLGGDTLSYSPTLLFVEIFVRGAAVNENTSVTVDELTLGGEEIDDSCLATGADGVDILRISGPNLLDGFVLAGQVTMIWSGDAPANDELLFQVHVGSPDPLVATEKKTWGWVKNRFRAK